MAISQSKYIDITSGVGGAATASRRELICRCMTSNVLAPTNTILEYNLAQTLAKFGSSSVEYTFALKYFGFISKSVTQAAKISFSRWTSAATAPSLISTITLPAYTVFAALTDTGKVKVDLGGETHDISPDFTGDATLADVAASLQLAVRAITAGGTMWTSATFAYADGAFTLTGGTTGAGDVGYCTAPASGTDIKALIGMDVASAPVLSVGMDAETPVEAMTRVSDLSDNFGSFMFLDTQTNADIVLVAAWNAAQNYKYLYSVKTTAANASALAALLDGYNGTILTLDNAVTAWVEYMPCAIFAATNYLRPNAVKNFMYQKFDSETATVTNDTDAATYDALLINYLGETQQAGQGISFYQDGVMMDGGDVGPYCNEIWLKDGIAVEFFNMLLALEQLPANQTGADMSLLIIQGVVDQALSNGTIQAGKTLTNVQKAYITQVTGDEDAWNSVQGAGYWVNVTIVSYVENSVTKYKVDYVLVYSKGDSIRKVTGSDILI